MTRPFARALTFSLAVLAGCSSSSAPETTPSGDGGKNDSGTTDARAHDATGSALGAPCVPSEESSATFQGFSVEDVSLESNAPTCVTGSCLVNHFQGRVTCPYGQTAPGMGPKGPSGSPAAEVSSEDGCVTAGASRSSVTATNVSVAGFAAGSVPAQITGAGAGDRTANKTVYCSCRCANADGKTDDGATYCACPGGFACTQLITAIGPGSDTAGAYCVLAGTTYTAETTNSADVCSATVTDVTEPGYCPLQR
jgi:hypothetical protein